ncbi:MAG: CRISPR-associated endonuclease Cas1 [Phascolarctobacterium sp.]|nr:CRISPR-associated endonuclease Cas1 [Phascolarctobacterium sp.]
MTSIYITENGAYLRKRGGHVIIGRNNEVLLEVPLERVEDVTVVDNVQVSSALATEFLERNIPLSWISSYGKFYGSLVGNGSVDVLKHKKQFELLEQGEFYFKLAQKVVFAKIHNQITVLRRYNRNVLSEEVESSIKNILAVRKNVFLTTDYRELMGYEGIISRIYFSALGSIVTEPFNFDRRTKQPPRDPVNSMLSLGYSMLFNEILSNVISTGLHPYVGFLHRIAKGHPALVSDLMEEWRAVVIDSMVLAIIKRNMIGYEMFDVTDDGCFLNSEARKIFLQVYNKKLRSTNQYLDGKQTYRESLKQQCRKYASAIMHEDLELYRPMELR